MVETEGTFAAIRSMSHLARVDYHLEALVQHMVVAAEYNQFTDFARADISFRDAIFAAANREWVKQARAGIRDLWFALLFVLN